MTGDTDAEPDGEGQPARSAGGGSDAENDTAGPEGASAPAAVDASESVAIDEIPDGVRKLHRLSVPYRAVQQGIGIAVGILIIGGGGTLEAIRSGDPLLAGGALAAILVVIGLYVGYFVAYYRRFEYELTPDTFDIRSGVVSRREREIPLRRIQNVDISQNVVQRALGVAEVGIETAGGGGTEAQLQYVSVDEADRLQAELSRLSRAAKAQAEGRDVDEQAEAERFETVFSITDRELGILALVSIDFRVASILFFAASVFAPSFASAAQPDVIFGPETFAQMLYGPIAGLVVVLALAVLSGVISATRYYGFQLDSSEDELRYERGLVQQFRGTIPREKIQTLTVRENVLARALGYASLYIETAGSAAGAGGSGQTSQSQAAIPLADRDRVDELAHSLEDAALDSFERPPTRARWRYAVRYAGALVLLSGLLYVAEQFVEYSLFWYVPLVAIVLVPVAAHLKWSHRGYALDDDHVVTRNGFWIRRTKVVPLHRVQTVIGTGTIFQRRRDLATLTVDTAGSRSLTGEDAQAVDYDAETIDALREQVADGLYVSLRRRAAERRRSAGRSASPEAGGDGERAD